jgi:tRNA threonylcarbamoyladenosine biosynthesis protein TsaE
MAFANCPPMVTRISRSPDETRRLGAELARTAEPGLVVGLIGDLGAGKTQFVKGFAEGLGSNDRVHSPTFTLLNEYGGGRLPLYHLDLYRLESPNQLHSAGLDDYLPPREGVALIEWFDRCPIRLPKLAVVTIRQTGENEREIAYEYPRP